MNKIVFFLSFLSIVCSAQENTIDYIAYSDNTYYEILKHKKNVTVIKYYLNESKLKKDTLDFTSLEETKNKLRFETIVKSKRLEKELNIYPKEPLQKPNFGSLVKTEKLQREGIIYERIGLDFKTNTDTLYTFQFHRNGNKELWYLSGDDSLDIYNRFWCRHKEQPVFIPVRNKKFDVILVQKSTRLSLIYFDKRKGIQGNIRF